MSRTQRKKEDVSHDNYPTPHWATDRFLEKWPLLKKVGPRWLEPCVGDGAIIKRVQPWRPDIQWTTVDIRDTRAAINELEANIVKHHVGSFFDLDASELSDQRFDVAIFNPPFPLTIDMVLRCFEFCDYVIAMQRANFIGSELRNEFFKDNMCDLYVLPNRCSFTGNGKADSIEHGWHLWPPTKKKRTRGELHLLDVTSLEERKFSWERVAAARDAREVALNALFREESEDE